MRRFKVKVNGEVFEVEVEEVGRTEQVRSVRPAAPAPAQPVTVPSPIPRVTPVVPAAAPPTPRVPATAPKEPQAAAEVQDRAAANQIEKLLNIRPLPRIPEAQRYISKIRP